MRKTTAEKPEKDSNFTTWKLNLENIVNADPLLGPACLSVVRAYLDWMGSASARPYRSIIDLRVATSLAENTIIKARRQLEAAGYFVPDGKNSSGAIRYKILNAGENRVLDHMTISRETLARIDAEKKEREREKRARTRDRPSETEGPMSPSETEGRDSGRALRNCRDRPSETEGNYVKNSVEALGTEEEGHSLQDAFVIPCDPDQARLWVYQQCTDKSRIAWALGLLAEGKLTADIIREIAA
ncbi:hypothetical protein OIU34_26710 [Pararhizobium sp. BT-229]|uniref:hypothetical protein n=1 Tax=Pararhizobium sp. BT-229 TaxID=2986923 RepID=UPI0021F7E09C|nr:hypothetical protein [Pararhizobium sp. BT-229]MCV9965475.1 hypothetical protein [Pararhizobium sp. BT-229]